MEEWQRKYVIANMRQLVEVTICNETLLSSLSSDGILSLPDLDDIRSTRQRLERSRRLYDILQTRVGGFGAMSRALAGCMQSGAHEIFRKGYIECLPHTLKIIISRQTIKLSKYLAEAEIREIIQEHVHVFENKGPEFETVPLLRHAQPPDEPPLYIPRKLFRRNVVNTDLFQQTSADIFVIKGVHDFYTLVKIVRPQIASKSSSQLGNLTCRFIQLEDDEHWNDICDIATAPIHLIKYEEETKTCVLVKTKGTSNIIKQHITRVQKKQNDDLGISEDSFIQEVVSDSASGVCICDLPGMGKTLLLAKFSKKISELYPDRLVAFISLSQFIKSVASNDIPPNCSKQVAQKFLVEYLAASSLAQDILEKMFAKEEIGMELLFDAFDEVPFQFIGFAKILLTQFATELPNARVYVTSRPHMRQELEDSLGVHSYDILPFSKANQLEFLVSFWKSQYKVGNDEKLELFANYILEKLKGSLSKTEENMTGIPLQCRLLAQVYSRGAKLHATHAISFQECCHFEGSLPQLYREYVQQIFNKKLSSPEEEALSSEVQKYHIWMAIKTLFPECESQLMQELTRDMADFVVDLSISIGILEGRVGGSGQTVEFVHRTFAEYFVSEFIAQMLNNSQLATSLSTEIKSEVVKLLLERALMTRKLSDADEIEDHVFVNSVVVYFLSFFLDLYRPWTSIQYVVQQFPSSVSPNHLSTIFFGCARENYITLLGFIHAVLLAINKMTLEQYKNEMLPLENPQHNIIRVLNVASLLSSRLFIEELFTLFLKCFECDLGVVCKEIALNQDTPLHFAIERADIEMVQFFVLHVSLEGRDILGSCVIGSNEYPLETVNRKAEICKVLLSINGNLLTEADHLLYGSIHVELIKVLIEEGADARAKKAGKNIVHSSAGYMSSSHFHELCRFLILDLKAEDLFVANEPKWKSPLPLIFQRQEKVSIETCSLIWGIDEVDINEKDDHENNLFLNAVERNHDMELLEFLVKAGADIHAVNAEGQNALHLAAEAKNSHILTFLLNLEIDCCQQDSVRNSFLHLLGSEGVTAEEYQVIISLLVAKEQTDVFHVRNIDGKLPIHWSVYHLELTKQTMQLLKSNLVDFNAVDFGQWSVLMYAIRGERSVQFLEMLIDLGADIMKKNKDGWTFAHLISKHYTAEQYHKLVVFLISKGFDKAFAAKDDRKMTPLHWAACFVELLPETLELFHRKLVQENKVDINSQCNSGMSILMYAVEGNRSSRILKAFIEMGADVYIQDIEGNCFSRYIRNCCSLQQNHEMVEFLKNRGQQDAVAKNSDNPFQKFFMNEQPGSMTIWDHGLFRRVIGKISSVNALGYSILMSAAQEKRSVSLLKSLIEKGADIHMQNESGDNFAHRIAYNYSAEQYHKIVEFIIRRDHQTIFAVANNDGETPIQVAVLKLELLVSTLDLFDSSLFQTNILDINSTDNRGISLLMYAAQGKRSVSLLKNLIERGADVHIRNQNGFNFAHCIPSLYSPEQYHEIVEFLINRGEQKVFAVKSDLQRTPVHVAVDEQALLEPTLDLFSSTLFQTKIVDINSTVFLGDTLLISAAKEGRSVSLLKNLIENGADVHIQGFVSETFAHVIAYRYSAQQYHELVEFLINRGEQKVFAVKSDDWRTPVHVAVAALEILEPTLDLFSSILFQTKIVDINTTDEKGGSILMYAAEGRRSVQLLKFLIDNGANIQCQNKYGNNFAHYLAQYYSAQEFHEMVEFIIGRDQQNVFAVSNKHGVKPIHFAVSYLELHSETLKLLLACYVPQNHESLHTSQQQQESFSHGLNEVDDIGDSVLHWALKGKRSLQFVKNLIRLGADWLVKNNYNSTLAHLSALKGLVGHLKYFVELGCEVNALDNLGDNVLQCAVGDASENVYEMLTFLLDNGADKNHKNKWGDSAYAYATKKEITDKRILDVLK